MTKSLRIIFLLLIYPVVTYAQEAEISTGNFGETISKKGAVSAVKLRDKMSQTTSLEIKVKGTIAEVCQAKGCWMTLDLGDNEFMRVRFKDYGFFVPKNAAGKTATVEGVAQKEIIDVDELRHLAEDAGKSKEKIDAIDQPTEELTFVADGVIIE